MFRYWLVICHELDNKKDYILRTIEGTSCSWVAKRLEDERFEPITFVELSGEYSEIKKVFPYHLLRDTLGHVIG